MATQKDLNKFERIESRITKESFKTPAEYSSATPTTPDRKVLTIVLKKSNTVKTLNLMP